MISLAEMVTIVTGSGPGTGHRLGAMSFARAAVLIWGSRDTTMTQYGTWVSYSGTARIVLAIVLLAAAGGVAYAGTRLPLPARPARPGQGARTFMLVSWGFAIIAFLVCLPIYVKHARQEHLLHAAPADPITPVTVICRSCHLHHHLSCRQLTWLADRAGERRYRSCGRADDL